MVSPSGGGVRSAHPRFPQSCAASPSPQPGRPSHPPTPAPAVTSQPVPSSCARPAPPHARLTPSLLRGPPGEPPSLLTPCATPGVPRGHEPPTCTGTGAAATCALGPPSLLGAAPPRAHRACPEPGHTPARSSPERTLPASAPGPRYPARRHGAHRGGGRGPLRSLALPAAAHAALPPGESAFRVFRVFRAFRGLTPAPDPAHAPMAPPMAS